jgi:hypothetical protein
MYTMRSLQTVYPKPQLRFGEMPKDQQPFGIRPVFLNRNAGTYVTTDRPYHSVLPLPTGGYLLKANDKVVSGTLLPINGTLYFIPNPTPPSPKKAT